MKFKTENDDDIRLLNGAKAVLKKLKNNTIRAAEFDMSTYHGPKTCRSKTHVCKTAACLGGWISKELFNTFDNPIRYSLDVSNDVRLRAYALFAPASDWAYTANKKQGIAALIRFIDGYKKPWQGVEH